MRQAASETRIGQYNVKAAGALSAIRFFTDTGIAVPAVTADQMREIDRIAVEGTGPKLLQMMENAGRTLALLAIDLLGINWQKASVVVLAGSGGNGGGGICAARHLANRTVNTGLCLARPGHLQEVAALQRKVFQVAGGKEMDFDSLSQQRPDLIVDALIGYGLNSAPQGTVAQLIRWANGTGAPILSLDVPSGVEATTGQTPDEFVKPRWTLTLALPKTGLSPQNSGELFLADLGIPEGAYRRMGLAYSSPFGERFWVRLSVR